MLLIDKGADCNLAGEYKTPLFSAAYAGDLPLMKALVEHGANVNAASAWGTPVGQSILYGHVDAFNYLLTKGADVNEADSTVAWHRTPLIWLAQGDYASVPEALTQISALLKAGANPNLKAYGGRTALMEACLHNLPEVALALIAGGADVNATDDHGATALAIAGEAGNQKLVDILKSGGAAQTDVHILAREPARERLTPRQAWSLALGAVYNLRNHTNYHELGGGVPRNPQDFQQDLEREWGNQGQAGFRGEAGLHAGHGGSRQRLE